MQAAKVDDLASFLAIMRYNEYKTDPYSQVCVRFQLTVCHAATPPVPPFCLCAVQGSPWNAICSRGDLAGSPDGCYDTKGSSSALWAAQEAWIVNGPTTNGGQLPPFSWSQFPATSHVGLPVTYNFSLGAVAPAWV